MNSTSLPSKSPRSSIQSDLDKKIKDEIRQQLEPYFAKIYSGSPALRMYEKYAEAYRKEVERFIHFTALCGEGLEDKYPPTISTILNALLYLAFVETMAAREVDWMILQLIAQGQDFHLEPDYEHRFTRHAQSLEDLRSPNLSLSLKLDFLESKGISFFSKYVDLRLRNKIAHLSFEVGDDGTFFMINGNHRKRVDLREKIRILWKCCSTSAFFIGEEIRRSRNLTKKPPKSTNHSTNSYTSTSSHKRPSSAR